MEIVMGDRMLLLLSFPELSLVVRPHYPVASTGCPPCSPLAASSYHFLLPFGFHTKFLDFAVAPFSTAPFSDPAHEEEARKKEREHKRATLPHLDTLKRSVAKGTLS